MSMRVVACHDRQTADRKSEITMATVTVRGDSPVPTTSTVVFDTNCSSVNVPARLNVVIEKGLHRKR